MTQKEFKQKIKDTPFIPDEVYEHLPKFLTDCIGHLNASKRERDAFLAAALGVISGCIKGITGRYHRSTVFPNLFVMIVAPPAQGKAVVDIARMLAEAVHDAVVESNEESSETSKNKLPKVLFIPADASSAAFLELLRVNDGQGLMVETEIDSLVNSQDKEWGNFTVQLRKVFHHEGFSNARVGTKQYVQIKRPRLSIVLAGTFSQFFQLLPSAENGLFSRFLFYTFIRSAEWTDVEPCIDCAGIEDTFLGKSLELFDIIKYIEKYPSNFVLTSAQWKKLNEAFSEHLSNAVLSHGEEASGIVYRMGLIAFRIAMILSALRKAEDKREDELLSCTDADLIAALKLTETYLVHSTVLLESVSGIVRETISDQKKFFEELPASFERKQAIVIGKKYMAPRTVDDHLSKWVEKGLLSKPGQGRYVKVNFEEQLDELDEENI